MRAENKDIIEYLLEYVQRHTFLSVRSFSHEFKGLFFEPRTKKLNKRELTVKTRKVSNVLGWALGLLRRGGYIKKEDIVRNKVHRITPKMIEGLQKILNDEPLQLVPH